MEKINNDFSEKQVQFIKKKFGLSDDTNIDLQQFITTYQGIIDRNNKKSSMYVTNEKGEVIFTLSSLQKHIGEQIEKILVLRDSMQSDFLEIEDIYGPNKEKIGMRYNFDYLYKEKIISDKIAEILRIIISSDFDLKKVSQEILEVIQKITRCELAYTAEIEHDTISIISFSKKALDECEMDDYSSKDRFKLKNPGGLLSWGLKNKKSFYCNHIENDERSIGVPKGHVPIKNFLCAVSQNFGTKSEIIGQINIANSPYYFKDGDIKIIEEFADLLGIAIEKHKKEVSKKKQIEFQKNLNTISNSFLKIQNTENFLNNLGNALILMKNFFEVEQVYLFELEDNKNEFINTFHYADEMYDENSQRTIPFSLKREDYSLFFDKLLNGEYILYPNVDKMKDCEEKKDMQKRGVKTFLAFPLMKGNKFHGFFGLNTTKKEKYWREREILGLQTFSSLLGNIFEKYDLENNMIEARKKAEEANTIKSQFLANMSHEIRTPLNGIFGIIEQLIQGDLDAETTKLYYEKLEESKKRLLGVINNILDISKIEQNEIKLNLEKTNLEKVISSIIFLQKHSTKKSIDIFYQIDTDIKERYFWIDSQKFSQIINNLINNAIKFTNEGIIKVDVKLIKDIGEQKSIQIDVIDTGDGIAENDLEKIFQKFIQAENTYIKKQGGTGLGLSICKNLVEFMGGKISVKSKLGKGTCFSIILDLNQVKTLPKGENDEKKENVSQANDKSVEYYSKYRVLVADDEPLNQIILRKLLEKRGYSVVCVSNGQEAIDIYENESFDIIFMDIQMPEISGDMATKKIRENDTNIPIIALSALSIKEDIEKIIKIGFNQYITKPVSKDSIYNTLDNFLEEE